MIGSVPLPDRVCRCVTEHPRFAAYGWCGFAAAVARLPGLPIAGPPHLLVFLVVLVGLLVILAAALRARWPTELEEPALVLIAFSAYAVAALDLSQIWIIGILSLDLLAICAFHWRRGGGLVLTVAPLPLFWTIVVP